VCHFSKLSFGILRKKNESQKISPPKFPRAFFQIFISPKKRAGNEPIYTRVFRDFKSFGIYSAVDFDIFFGKFFASFFEFFGGEKKLVENSAPKNAAKNGKNKTKIIFEKIKIWRFSAKKLRQKLNWRKIKSRKNWKFSENFFVIFEKFL
jgi:hypothetical protein